MQAISPLSVSPVLRRLINITFDAGFNLSFTPDDFDIQLVSKSAPNYIKKIPVTKTDNATKIITVKFYGAISGDYNWIIKHSQWGLFNATHLTLKVESHVSSITPLTGSIYGGTLVTLQGKNWGMEHTDNPVEIFFGSQTPNKKCYVVSTNETTIKCRLDTSVVQTASDKGTMITFLKTYEEANCTLQNKCEFTFTATVPQATAIASQWDNINNRWTVKITGTGITGTPA